MGRARITNGIWTRNVNWEHAGDWRIHIFKNTLSDPRLRLCRSVLGGGPTVLIPAHDMRRVLEGGPGHYDGNLDNRYQIAAAAYTSFYSRAPFRGVAELGRWRRLTPPGSNGL